MATKKTNYSCSALEMIMERANAAEPAPDPEETSTQEEEIIEAELVPLAPMKRNEEERTTRQPGDKEAKSRRVQLLIQPSIYKEIKRKAAKEGKSFNDYIHKLMEDDLAR